MTAERTQASILVLLSMLLASSGCPDEPAPADGGSGSSGPGSTSTGIPAETTTGSTDDVADTTAGSDDTASDATETGTTTGEPPLPPLPCPDDWVCQADDDGDERPIACDNAPEHSNPDQADLDFDGIGDVADLCPTVQSLSNEADSDDDGVGNECDLCRYRPIDYQGTAVLPARYDIRNNPYQGDVDRDGIGDACDNCPTVPNCLGFGDGPGLVPHQPGMPVDLEDPDCQGDFDNDGVGDACQGDSTPGAAGPIGLASTHDFDQDGLANAVDGCPRLPVDLGTCAGPGDCPEGSACTDGVCNHPDPDADGVGSECDTCPFAANPGQVIDGMRQVDDDDGDFVGTACETGPACATRHSPRALAFYDVAVGGYCCTTVYQGQALEDPDGNALDLGDLPDAEPGRLELPPGCAEALAAAGVRQASALGPADVGGLPALWRHVCLLPPWDQDYDGLGDPCDLCPFAFDPTNAPYVDQSGMEWPNDGAYCNGAYHCSADE